VLVSQLSLYCGSPRTTAGAAKAAHTAEPPSSSSRREMDRMAFSSVYALSRPESVFV